MRPGGSTTGVVVHPCMRTSGSVQLEAWVAAQGGLRAAGRALGIGHGTIRRWVVGDHPPEDRQMIAQRTGVPADSWDRLEATTRPVVEPPPPGAPLPPPPALVTAAPPPPAPASAPLPARAAPLPPPPAPATTPPLVDDEPEDEPLPATLRELQDRARAIPEELKRLRRRVAAGAVAVNAGEIMARMIEREGRRIDAAVNAMGTASVQEVEDLRALLVDVTQGCEACRARVTAALRGGAH
jgi:hypothetical protein